MPAVPTVPDLMDGIWLTSMLNDGVIAAVNFLLNRPAATVRQVTLQPVPNNAWTAIDHDAEDFDLFPTGGSEMHSTSTNPSRLTASYPGVYGFGGQVAWAFNATGARGARWSINGTTTNEGGTLLPTVAATFGAVVPAPVMELYLSEGDYIELQAFQNSGAALNTGVTVGGQSFVSIAWLRN